MAVGRPVTGIAGGGTRSHHRANRIFSRALREELEKITERDGISRKNYEHIVYKLVDMACSGVSLAAISEVMDRVDGKVATQLVGADDENGNPTELKGIAVVFVDPPKED